MECNCEKEEKVNHLVMVINSQIMALEELLPLTKRQRLINSKLLQVIRSLQSSIQEEQIDMKPITCYESHLDSEVGTETVAETSDEGESLLHPAQTVTTVIPGENSSVLPSDSNDPNLDPLEETQDMKMGKVLSKLDLDETKKKEKAIIKTYPGAKIKTEPTSGKKTWKRKVDYSLSRDVNKEKRMRGEAYVGYTRITVPVEGEIPGTSAYKSKSIPAAPRRSRQVGSRCLTHLQKSLDAGFNKVVNIDTAYQCYRVCEETRHSIFDYFWKKLDWNQRKVYISALVTIEKIQRRRSVGHSRRCDTYKYYLRMPNHQLIRVCKSFFTKTFDIGERVIRDWVQGSLGPKPEEEEYILPSTINDDT